MFSRSTICSIKFSETWSKADFSMTAETDGSVWSSASLLAQVSSGQERSSWFSLVGRFEIMDGSSL